MNLLMLLSLVLIVAGFAFAGKGFRNLEVMYETNGVRFERIEEATPGPADVSGEVVTADDECTALFSDATCVLYGVVVEEKHQQGDGPLWQVSSGAQHGVPFYLSDETGKLLVDPDGIDFDLPEKNVLEVPNGVVPPDPIRVEGEKLKQERPEWVEPLDLNLLTCQTSRDTRFREYYLEPGEECHVYGTVMKREEGRNALYDDEETPVVYQSSSTPSFVLSKEPLEDEIEAGISVLPWMIAAALFLFPGILGMTVLLA